MKKNRTDKIGISLISLIITIIVIIILAAIVIFTGLNAPDRANLAKFMQNISDFRLAVQHDFANKKVQYATEQKSRTNAQIYYIIAKGGNDSVLTDINDTLPEGDIKVSSLGVTGIEGTEAYLITPANEEKITNWGKAKTYYEDGESHYITDAGDVFVIKGYRVEEDGADKWYLNERIYTSNAIENNGSGQPLAGSTFGEHYDDTMIGKTIAYASANNNVTDWIILGKQENAQGKNDVIITTKNPVSAQEIQLTLEEWTEYETKINNACKNYIGETGMLGLKTFTAKEVRSITIEDINNTVGFSETINPVTLGGTSNDFAYPKDDGSGWIVKGTDENYTLWSYPIETYFYFDADGYKFSSATNHFSNVSITLGRPNCMKYIMANNTAYWVSSRCVDLRNTPQFNVFTIGYGPIGNGTNFCSSNVSGGNNRGGTNNMSLRPIVVISSETPWDDVKDLIGNYATYN